jgi:hypothetical protein
VQRAVIDREGGFFDDFGEAGVGVRRAGDVFGAGAELDGDDQLGQEIAGVGSQDVGAEDAIGLRVREDLDLAIGGVEGARAAVGFEGEDALLVGDTRFLQLFFGLTDAGDFRVVGERTDVVDAAGSSVDRAVGDFGRLGVDRNRRVDLSPEPLNHRQDARQFLRG